MKAKIIYLLFLFPQLIIATISKLSKSISFATVAEPSSDYEDNRLGDGNSGNTGSRVRDVVPEPFNFANLQRWKTKYDLEGIERALKTNHFGIKNPSSLSKYVEINIQTLH